MTRKFTMTPIEPRTAGTLKGFGFTVTWGDKPASHVAAAVGGDGAGASVSTDTPPKPVNDDFARIQVIGSIR